MVIMRRFSTGCALLALAAAGAGCADVLGGGSPSSSFQANLVFSEGETHSYRGDGDFYEGPNTAEGLSMRFDLHSQAGNAEGWQRFYLHRRGDGMPSPGSYALTAIDMSEPGARGVTALYLRKTGDVMEYYQTQSGELQVSAASGRRVEGTFRFNAFRYCVIRPGGVQEGPCAPVGEPIAGAATIEVTGSFSAVPLDEDDIEDASAVVPIP